MDESNELFFGFQAAIDKTGAFTTEQIRIIMDEFCRATSGYDIKKTCTDLIPCDPVPKTVYEYLAVKKMEGRSDATLRNYRLIIENFFMTVQKRPEEVCHKDVWAYLIMYQNSREKPVSNRTMEQYRQYIAYYFDWMQDVGYLQNNPTKSMNPIKFEKKKKPAMTRHDLVVLEKAAKDAKERAVITFAYATGCRVSELVSIRIKDIDWENRSLVVLGKGNKHRRVYFNDRAEVCLRDYLKTRVDDNPYLFVSARGAHQVTTEAMRKLIKKVYERVADEISVHVSPHTLRHTCGTLALRAGMKVEQVQEMLGHESLETTMQYIDMEQQRTAEAYDKFVI